MSINKKFLSIVSVFLISALALAGCKNTNTSSNSQNGKKKVVIGTSASYSPWAFQKDDKLQGFEIDVWNEIAKRNNYELEFKLSKFSGLVGMLDANQIDTIAHQMSITPARQEKYAFSEPYAYSYYDFAVKKDSTIKTLEDLKGKKVGCWAGGNGEATIRDINKKNNLNLNIITYDGAPIETEVEVGRLDAAWQGEIKTLTTIEQNKLNLKMLGIKPFYEVNAYPFLKNEKGKELAKEVTKTITEMRNDGTLKKFSEKWFKIDTTVKPQN